MVLGGEEGSICEITVDGRQIEHVSEFKHVGFVLNELSTDGAECYWKVGSGRRVTDAIRSLVNAERLKN